MADDPSLLSDPAWVNRQLEAITRQIRELGPSIAASFAPVVANLQATIIATIQATYSTTAQMNAAIASPGNITPGNVTASGTVQGGGLVSTGSASIATGLGVGGNMSAGGQVVSAAPIKSPGSHGYNVTTSYVAGWIDGDGTFGTSPSSGAVKVDLAVIADADSRKILDVVPYWGRYEWDAPDSPLKAFVLAEDVQAAGFGPDVAPTVDDDAPRNIGTEDDPVLIQPGKAWTVNYSQLVVPLLALAREQDARIATLESQVAQLVAGGDAVDGGS
ncbi:hypothetical protein [Humibacter sp. RRB41]|uniref:hypothetical protein n=1 Tax=Humibacter sp. RRB41 TaxID=2919946 RepID=UPI001FAA6E63|nr:hypothetical protein [Humibacter sp. RRB41]